MKSNHLLTFWESAPQPLQTVCIILVFLAALFALHILSELLHPPQKKD